MGAFEVFIIRLVLAVLIAVLIGRIFAMTPIKTGGLAALMLALAYLSARARKRDRE